MKAGNDCPKGCGGKLIVYDERSSTDRGTFGSTWLGCDTCEFVDEGEDLK